MVDKTANIVVNAIDRRFVRLEAAKRDISIKDMFSMVVRGYARYEEIEYRKKEQKEEEGEG